MKKQFTTSIGKKVATLVTASVILLGSATASFAFPDKAITKSVSANISYSGLKDQYTVFKVDYKNETLQPFELLIKNENQEIIFSKMYDGKPLNTDVYLSEVPDNCKLTFLIKTGKKNISQTFEISRTYKSVPEMEVTGL